MIHWRLTLTLILFFLSAGVAQLVYSQTPALGTLPFQYTPSFAGSAGQPRIALLTGLTKFHDVKEISLAISADNYFKKISTGVGVQVFYYNFSFSNSTLSQVLRTKLAISPKISIRGKYTIAPAVSINCSQYSTQSNISTNPLLRKSSNFNFSAGMLFNSKKFYLGYTASLTVYRIADTDEFIVPLTSYVQTGFNFQRNPESEFSFTPQLLFTYYHPYIRQLFDLPHSAREVLQAMFIPEIVNLNFRYRKLIWGVGTSLIIGYQSHRLRIMYEHKLGDYGLIPVNGNLSLRYLFNPKQQKAVLWN